VLESYIAATRAVIIWWNDTWCESQLQQNGNWCSHDYKHIWICECCHWTLCKFFLLVHYICDVIMIDYLEMFNIWRTGNLLRGH